MNALIILFIFVPVLTLILLALNLLFSVHKPDSEKLTSYECGFSPIHNQTRTPFSVQFYLVAILFLVFDLELLVLYPITVSLYEVGALGFWVVLIFFSVLTVGFVYELGSGALKSMLPVSRNVNTNLLNIQPLKQTEYKESANLLKYNSLFLIGILSYSFGIIPEGDIENIIISMINPLFVIGVRRSEYANLSHFHTSSTISSDNNTRLKELFENNFANIQKNDELALVKYIKDEPIIDDLSASQNGSSNYPEAFPWLWSKDDSPIDYNKPISLFDGIHLVSQYLETKFDVNPGIISNSKITEILEPFLDNKNITAIQLFNHIHKLYYDDPAYFLTIKKDIAEGLMTGIEKPKPLGDFGELTLNESYTYLKELKWSKLYYNTEVTVNALPALINLIGYKTIVNQYVKHYHNRPFKSIENTEARVLEQTSRNRYLAGFLVLGAPVILMSLKAGLGIFNDTSPITIKVGNDDNTPSSMNSAGILGTWILAIQKKIPDWLKFLLKVLGVSLVLLKLFGFSIVSDILLNFDNIKRFVILGCFLSIFYHILYLYLIYKFSKGPVNIPSILPKFLIDWLKDFTIIVESPQTIEIFKDMSYKQLFLYILILILLYITSF